MRSPHPRSIALAGCDQALLRGINTYLMRWARKKFKRLRAYKRVKAWWKRLVERQPEMFAHWAWMRAFTF